MMLVTQRGLVLTIYKDQASSVPERAVMCDPMHVTHLEQIDGEARQSETNPRI